MDGYDQIVEHIERREGLNRREMLRRGGAFAISGGALAVLAGCGDSGGASGGSPAQGAATAAASGPIKRGGTLRVTDEDFRTIKDPATLSGSGDSNIVRQVAEFLTKVDDNNVPQPYLLKSIDASPNLKTWTLKLREGPMFNTPKPRGVDADDVIFNMHRWLDKDVGSSMGGLIGGYLDKSGIEKVDDKTIVLHTKAPTITLPYDLFEYSAAILPKEFEGDFTKQPWGTGPFTLAEFVEGEKAILKARPDYWQKGEDGDPLPYLAEIQQLNIKLQATQQLAGLTTNQYDLVNRIDISIYETLKSHKDLVAVALPSGANLVFRMRTDVKPFDDQRVRDAFKLAQDREQLIKVALRGTGVVAGDDLMIPTDPANPKLSAPPRDVAKAKQLLADAGYPDGFDFEMKVLNAPEWETVAAQTLQQQLKEAGIRLKLTPMVPDGFWAKWTDWNLAAVEWGHRPLAVQIWNFALRCGAEWNETHWCDKKFEGLLDTASGLLEPEKRKAAYTQVQEYLRDQSGYAAPFNVSRLFAYSTKLQNYKPRADVYQFYGDVWLNA
jgi:peptide/nickel transport system substrate-binding protein